MFFKIRNTPVLSIRKESRPIWRYNEPSLRRFVVNISFFGGGGYKYKRVPRGFSIHFGLRPMDFKAVMTGSRTHKGLAFRITRNGNHGFYIPR